MQQYEVLNNPNLPENDVILAAVGVKYIETIKRLNEIGVKTIAVQKNKNLPEYLNAHTDLNLMHFSSDKLFFDSGIISGDFEEFFEIKKIGESVKKDYPSDCLLNAVIIGKTLICNKKSISKDILNEAEINGLKIINVNQGYTKCSICPVNENCIITDDLSVYRSVQNFFNDVLFIEKGSIRLEGADYGFIGGATGKLSKNKLAFNGRLDSHSDCNKIIDLLNKYSIEPIELTNDKLTDIGSIIPLLQKKAL